MHAPDVNHGRVLITGAAGLVGTPAGCIPYAHVDNFTDAIVTAARTPEAAAQPYNIVDGQTTGREFFDRFSRWLGLDPLPARHEMVPWRGHFSGAKARRELGYAPRVSYEEVMAETERHLVELDIIKRR